MYTAYSQKKEIITLLNLSRDNIESLKSQLFYCTACLAPVYIKNGLLRLPHFAHYQTTFCCMHFERETQEHLELKKLFTQWCEQGSITYELEKYLPELNQRPDILIDNIAVEIQCSYLSIEKLIERSKNYQVHGYTPLWICGEKLLFKEKHKMSQLTKHMVYYSEKLGFFIWGANYKSKELTLYYHIEEDWQQKSYYAKKCWRFLQDHLLTILNYPKQAKLFFQRQYLIGHLQHNYYIHLNKKVVEKSKKVQAIQSILYKNYLHILHLPHWFYYPGILIFGCKRSDLLIKMVIWQILLKLENKIVREQDLVQQMNQILLEHEDFFYLLPNVSRTIFYRYCVNQLLHYLIKCDHLLVIKDQRYYVRNLSSHVSSEFLYEAFKIVKYQTLNSSVPMKNMIELIDEK